MKYAPLLQLKISHDYYPNSICSDFEVYPTLETEQILKNHRCILQKNSDGFLIIMEVRDNNRPKIIIPSQVELEFDIKLRNPDFERITDKSSFSHRRFKPLIFRSRGALDDGTLPLLPFAARNNLHLTHDVYARLILRVGRIAGRLPDAPRNYELAFTARLFRWHYYLVIDSSGNDKDNLSYKIRQGDDPGTSVNIFADGQLLDKLPDENDSLGMQLVHQYPQKQVWRFISNDAYSARRMSTQRLSLIATTGEIAAFDRCLQPPTINNLMIFSDEEGSDYATLYHVIKHF